MHRTEIPWLKQHNATVHGYNQSPFKCRYYSWKHRRQRKVRRTFVSEDTEIEIGLLVWRETKDEHQFAEESVSASGRKRSEPWHHQACSPSIQTCHVLSDSAPQCSWPGLCLETHPYPQCQSQPLPLPAKLSTLNKTIHSQRTPLTWQLPSWRSCLSPLSLISHCVLTAT